MPDLQVGRITFEIGGKRYEMSGPGLAVSLPDAAAIVAGESQWKFYQEKLRTEGAAAERARIRRELLAAIADAWDQIPPEPKVATAARLYTAGQRLRAALDRICPPEKGE